MPCPLRIAALTLSLAACAWIGCDDPTATDAPPASEPVVGSGAVDGPALGATPPARAEPTPTAITDAAPIELVDVKFAEIPAKIADRKPKFALVDAWASWCGPCKENFPHLVEMQRKYGDQGLAVYSLSFDGQTGEADHDAKEIAAAKEFLATHEPGVTHWRLAETQEDAFEKFDLTTIPAVFLYGPDGTLLKRFTWDDPNNQFTYEQVEAEVKALLGDAPTAGTE